MLGVGKLCLQREPLLDRHRGAEGRFDAVARAQPGDLGLDVLGQAVVGLDHVDPHRVAPDRRTFDAAEHAAERRLVAPGGVGMPGVLVAVVRHRRATCRCARAPDSPDRCPATGWSSSSPKWRANATCSARVMSWSRKNRTLCLQQQRTDLGDEPGVARRDAEVHVGELGADRAGQRLDLDRSAWRPLGRAAWWWRLSCHVLVNGCAQQGLSPMIPARSSLRTAGQKSCTA